MKTEKINLKSKFNQNFDNALKALTGCSDEDMYLYEFILKPKIEELKKESSKDNWMINAKLKNSSLSDLKSYEQTLQIISAGKSHYPLWVKLKEMSPRIIELTFSTRFRHLKTSHNQDTGFPPFEIVK